MKIDLNDRKSMCQYLEHWECSDPMRDWYDDIDVYEALALAIERLLTPASEAQQ